MTPKKRSDNVENADNIEIQVDEITEDTVTNGSERREGPAQNNEIAQELKEKIGEYEDKYVRLYADFENYKKRTAKEKADLYSYASAELIEKLLSVLDSFEIALKNKTEENPSVYEGIEKIFKQLKDVLESEGLCVIPCVGECFDPNCHHAVATDSSGDYKDNIITEEFVRGYQYKQKVLRPSMVKVNKR